MLKCYGIRDRCLIFVRSLHCRDALFLRQKVARLATQFTCFRVSLAFADRQGGGKTDDYSVTFFFPSSGQS